MLARVQRLSTWCLENNFIPPLTYIIFSGRLDTYRPTNDFDNSPSRHIQSAEIQRFPR